MKQRFEASANTINDEIISRILALAFKLCHFKKFDVEAIFYFLKQAENKMSFNFDKEFPQLLNSNINVLEDCLDIEYNSLEIDESNIAVYPASEGMQEEKALISQKSFSLENKNSLQKIIELSKFSKQAELASLLDFEQGLIVNILKLFSYYMYTAINKFTI